MNYKQSSQVMAPHNFRIHVAIRVISLGLCLWAFVHYLWVSPNLVRSVFLGGACLGLLVEIYRYIDGHNRRVTDFLKGLSHGDFAAVAPVAQQGGSFRALHETMEDIGQRFQLLSEQKEAQHLQLIQLMEHLRVGILCIDQQEEVVFINRALKNFLNRPELHVLSGLESTHPDLVSHFRNLEEGERRLIQLKRGERTYQLALRASAFLLAGTGYKLLSAQNIETELNQREDQAWSQLIRTLTHEIMNSVSPITSLSGSLQALSVQQPIEPVLPRLQQGLEVIQHRSQSLMDFTQAFRKLSRVPSPVYQRIEGRQFLDRLKTLFQAQFAAEGIDFQCALMPEDLSFQADPMLLEQALINLLKNALDALSPAKEGKVKLSIESRSGEGMVLKVSDNGPGISSQLREKIFVPFFTTKEQGSGIGLALCRRIALLHGGQLNLYAMKDKGSEFILWLPKEEARKSPQATGEQAYKG